MDTSKTEFKTQAFILTPQELKRIRTLFPDDGTIQITIKCRDDVERKYNTVEDFLQFENPPDKQITELLFLSKSQDLRNRTTIRLKNVNPYRYHNLFTAYEGDEAYVLEVSDKLRDRFSSMKPWYNWIAQHGAFLIICLLGIYNIARVIRLGSQSSYTLSNLVSDIASATLSRVSLFLVGIIVLSVFVLLFYWLLVKGVLYVFPMGVFAIGQGTKRHEHRDIWRTVVIVGFLINVIAGIALWMVM